jgi:predicted NBD/HSP70 family sugar kinase
VRPTIGLEIRDASVLALAVDDRGEVRARAAAAGADLAAAAVEAAEAVQADAASNGAAALGIATANPDAPAAARAIEAVAARFPDLFQQHAVVGSGTAAAMAEAWVGAARGAGDFVYFAVAEHAIAGVIRGGQPVTGAHGRAPAVAWMALNPVEREDYRRAGCLDIEVAAPGIVKRLIWRIKAGDKSRVQDVVNGDLAAITVDRVLDAARGGDGVSISVMRDTAKYLGMAAANLVAMGDPELLVLGGIMASAADLLLEPVRTELGRRLPAPMMSALTIVTALIGADAGALGAARHAWRNTGAPDSV